MKKVQDEELFQQEIANNGLTVAIFKTTWCPDCHFIDPFMPEVEDKYADRISFLEIDRDNLPELCEELYILQFLVS